jgi:putative salt-induced outer membrane protein YdiY
MRNKPMHLMEIYVNKLSDHRRMCFLTAIPVLLCLVVPVMGGEPGTWKHTIAAGLSLAQGNSESRQVNIEATTSCKSDAAETRLGAVGAYGESEGATSEENARVHAQHDRTIVAGTYAYLNAELFYDKVAAVDYRVVVGPGIGHKLINSETSLLALEAGASYVEESLADEAGGGGLSLRVMQRYQHSLSGGARIWETVELLPELDFFAACLLPAELGVETAISKQLSMRIVLRDKYDGEPASGSEENDVSIRASLVFIPGGRSE